MEKSRKTIQAMLQEMFVLHHSNKKWNTASLLPFSYYKNQSVYERERGTNGCLNTQLA